MKNNEELFNELVEESRDKLKQSVSSYGANAEDMLQEGLIHLWNNFDRYDPEKSFVAWARRIIQNKARDIIRKLKEDGLIYSYSDEITIPVLDNSDHKDSTYAEWRRKFAIALKKGTIDADDYALLSKHYGYGISSHKLAEKYDTSPAAIRQRVRRLKSKLLEQENIEDVEFDTDPID